MTDALDELEVIDLAASASPPRSRLYRQQILSPGTAQRESLSSFIIRLADAHSVPLGALVDMVATEAGLLHSVVSDAIFKDYASGGSAVSRRLVSALSAMTGHNCLADLTLMSVPANGLTSAPRRKWCPLCFEHDCQVGTPYCRLLWTIAPVESCPIHDVQLQHQHSCGTTRHRTNIRILPHVCRRCGVRLTSATGLVQATAEQRAATALVVDLLGDPKYGRLRDLAPIDGFFSFIGQVTAELYDGNAARLAADLGVSKGSTFGWIHRTNGASLSSIVKIAGALGCSLQDVFMANTKVVVRPAGRRTERKPRRKLPLATSPHGYELLRARLAELTAANESISLAHLASAAGVSARFIKHRFPEVGAAVVERHRQARTRSKEHRVNGIVAEMRKAAEPIVRQGLPVTWRRLREQSGKLYFRPDPLLRAELARIERELTASVSP